MSGDIFEEGGPHKIKKTGPTTHRLEIRIPPDVDGLLGRECPSEVCSPAYFKVRPGTGLSGQPGMYCPYCRHSAPPSKFASPGQLDYAKRIAIEEAKKGIKRIIGNAFGLDSSGERSMSAGMFSMKMKFTPSTSERPHHPIEEELRRDVTCPHCHLDQSVFGLATWCSDCGADIFPSHVDNEFASITRMLGDIGRRRKELGARVAGRDIENALEDTVSVFEAVLRVLLKRGLVKCGKSQEDIDDAAKRIGSKFQNVAFAATIFKEQFNIDVLDVLSTADANRLKTIFEKRHPITHNLGILDRKYLAKASSGEREGREVRVHPEEIADAITLSQRVLAATHKRLFDAPMSGPIPPLAP